jgi:putative FmdB family regulatory protein
MPIYEYHCPDCECSFETLVRTGDYDQMLCPSCGSVKVNRQMSVFASTRGAGEAGLNDSGNGAMRNGGACCGRSCGCH